jgi:hypothetical protein
MARLRDTIAALVSIALLIMPVWGTPSATLGNVVYADRAHVGAAKASVGTTVFDGDRLSTEQTGSVQIRAGAARLLLSSSSVATLSQEDRSPAATLSLGSVTFSTANSKAFVLHVAGAVIRPHTDEPTIGQVSVLSPKQLVVKTTRGSLTIAVDEDVRVIPEGASYRVVLDPSERYGDAGTQNPRVGGSKGSGGSPVKAGRSEFVWYAVATTAVVGAIALSEALESPDRP